MTPNEALDKAISVIGSMGKLAAALGITKGAVWQWKEEGRRIPAQHCPPIEELANHVVTCEQLRPDVNWSALRRSPKRNTRRTKKKQETIS